MTPSTFIARILGPVLVIIGLGLLLEGETFRAMAGEFLRSAALVYFSGVATLAFGLAILNVHHLWTRDWRSVITVFGWLSVIGGIFRILAPTFGAEGGRVVHRSSALADHGRHRHARARRLPLGHGLPGHLGRQAARASSHQRGEELGRARRRSAKRPRRKAGEVDGRADELTRRQSTRLQSFDPRGAPGKGLRVRLPCKPRPWRRPFEPDPGHAGEGTGKGFCPNASAPAPHGSLR